MQSSKRKRPDSVVPSSRRSSTRGTPSQRKLNLSTNDAAPSENPKNNPATKSKSQPGVALEVSKAAGTTPIAASEESSKIHVSVGESSTDPKTETKNVAQHQTKASITNSSSQVSPSIAAQEKQLRGLIAHRKLLLWRIQQSKAAAQEKLDRSGNVGKNDLLKKQTTSDARKPTNGGAASSTNKEVEAFREMIKQATQAAKKQRLEENSQSEKRSTTLRRVSSVGKRTTGTPTAAPVQATAQIPSTTQNQSAAPPPVAPPVVVVAPPTPIQPTQAQSSTYVATKKLKTSSGPSQVTKLQQAQTQESGKGRRSSAQKSSKSSSQNRSSPSQPYPHHFPQLPTKHPSVFDPAILRYQRPSVYCPEAVSLRERMKGLTSKLRSIIDIKLEQIHTESKTREQDSNTTTKGAPTKGDSRISDHVLPFRRRTHWDNVLEEMRWLSADFIEERKWKLTSARALGSAVELHTSQNSKKEAQSESKIKEVNEKIKLKKSESQTRKDTVPKPALLCKTMSADVERIHQILFPPPNEEKTKYLKGSARIISGMVSELWLGIEESGSIHGAQKEHVAGLKRHLIVRKSDIPIVNNSGEGKLETPITEAPEKGLDRRKEGMTIQTGVVSADEGDKDRRVQTNEEKSSESPLSSNHDILEHVRKLTDRMNKRARQRSKTKSPYSKSQEPVLLPVEQKAYDFLDFVWTGRQSGGGAILEDSQLIGVGEVITSLLRRHRDDGPHLVLCPPEKLLFWRQALARVTGAPPYFWGYDCGISLPEKNVVNAERIVKEFGPKDIVIVEFSVVCDGGKENMPRIPDMENFGSIVLDAFVPDNLAKKASSESIRKAIPCELLDEPWWNNMLRRCSEKIQRRVMISSFELLRSGNVGNFEMRGFSDRDRLNLLAAQSAFVYGPYLFTSKKKSPLHRVLSWGKHGIKGIKKNRKTKLYLIEEFLNSMLKPFRFIVEENLEPIHHSFVEKAVPELELRLCEMPEEQRAEYDRQCYELRGALALGGDFSNAAKGILELRKACFHSDLERVAQIAISLSGSNRESWCVGSISQSNFFLVSKLLAGSGKLRHLVEFFRDECGYKLAFDPSEEASKADPDFEKIEYTSCHRVAIIVSSIDSGRLVSALLTCLGVEHNMLINEGGKSDDEMLGVEGWTTAQLKLAKFSEDPLELDHPKVMISTPLIAAGQGNGLNLESSDMIAILDEDWSGREQEALTKLTEKCLLYRARRPTHRDFRIVRFIAKETCEHTFVDGTDENVADKIIQESNWSVAEDELLSIVQLSNEDHISPPEITNKLDLDALFNFPASNILAFQGRSLEDVLRNKKEMPLNLLSGRKQLFLPFQDNEVNREQCFKAFAQALINCEDNWKTAPRLVPSNCIKGIISRRDAYFLSVRHYIGRNCRQWSRVGVSNDENRSSWTHDKPALVKAEVDPSTTDDKDNETTLECKENSKTEESCALDSFLFYKPIVQTNVADVESKAAAEGMSATKKKSVSERINTFSKRFTTTQQEIIRSSKDGAFGFEPLVYFPPLFPGAREASLEAKSTMNTIHYQYTNAELGRKRKDQLGGVSGTSKRPRHNDTEVLQNGHPQIPLSSTSDSVTSMPRAGEETSAATQRPATAAVASDTHDHDSEKTDISNVGREEYRFLLFEQNEDYGLMGVGATSTILSSSMRAANSFTSVNHRTNENTYADMFSRYPRIQPDCDQEELEMELKGCNDGHRLKSVVLFVKKKPGHVHGGFSPYSHFSYPGAPGPPAPWMGHLPPIASPMMQSSVPSDKQSGVQKKSKKKVQGQANSAAAVSVLPNALTNEAAARSIALPHTTKPKDVIRHKLLASFGRIGYGGQSMFENKLFRIASIKVRNRINERVASILRKKAGGGVPHNMENHNNTNSWYGHEQFSPSWVPLVRYSSMKSPPPLPKFDTVDYGPFQIGSVPSISRFTAVSGPKPKIGVVLPMGVKLPPPSQPKTVTNLHAWTQKEDEDLRDLAARYCMNWLLVSHALGTEHQSDSAKSFITQRSARQCRERWELLTKPDGLSPNVILKEAVSSADSSILVKWEEQSLPVDSKEKKSSPEDDLPSILARKTFHKKLLVTTCRRPGNRNKAKKRAFAHLRKAQSGTQSTPLTIPGLVPGQKLAVVASHSSHHLSLQEAVATLNTGGRTEMWPLQILDLADKQRGKQQRAAAVAATTRSHPAGHASVSKPMAFSSPSPN